MIRPSRRGAVARFLTVIGALIAIWIPPQAEAHALLVSSSPADGQILGATPGSVVLHFDEALDTKLSRAVVTDPAGTRFGNAEMDGKTMIVTLSTNVPGRYVVDYKSVSLDDGHTITGSIRFGVATSAGGAGGGQSSWFTGSLIAVARWVEYLALLVAIGSLVLGWASRGPQPGIPVLGLSLVLLVGGMAVVAGESLQAGGGDLGLTLSYLFGTGAGLVRVTRLILEIAGVGWAVYRSRLTAAILLAIAVVISAAGHASDVHPLVLGVAVDAIHLVAAGIWAGGILVLALVALRGQWSARGATLLTGFGRVALWAFGVSILLGVVEAIQQVGSLHSLVSSAYGLTLLAKAIVVAAMIPLSYLAFRKRRLLVRSEALLALVVVAAAATLAALPLPVPPTEARAIATGTAAWSPQAGDLTLGGRAGNTLVGLALHPAHPGNNDATVYIAPPAGTHEAKNQQVRLIAGGERSTMRACGPSCRTTTVNLPSKASQLNVRVSGSDGGEATFDLPTLPAPSGSDLLARAISHMNSLTSYRVDENLSGIHSVYRYERPDRVRLSILYQSGNQDTLWVGPRRWERDGQRPWRLEQANGAKPPVPYFIWDPFKPLQDVHVMGTGSVQGHEATIVTFFGGHGKDPEPVWFKVWIAGNDTVLQSRMFAPGHFMRDTYLGLNRSGGISAPSS